MALIVLFKIHSDRYFFPQPLRHLQVLSYKHGRRQGDPGSRQENYDQLHEFSETSGYVLDAGDAANEAGLKVARDGHTILIPQPSDDPNDPLNWTRFKKHLILFIISATAFLPDYGSATGAVTLLPQAT